MPTGEQEARATSWPGVLKRALKGFQEDNLTDWAAALTYYGVLAVFPALLVLVSVLGLVGESVTQPLLDELATATPGPAQEILTDAIKNLQGSSASGVFLVIGLLGAVWSASGYIAGFMRASNAIHGVEDGQSFLKALPTRVGLTVLLMVLTGICAVAVAVSGGVARDLGDLVGVGDTAVTVWGIAKWPVLLVFVSFLFAVLYWAAPAVERPGFRWLSAGGLFAVLGWALASAGFAFYVGAFASYNKTYGALAGPIVFLVWLWISNIMILLGAEVNAEVERERAIRRPSA